MKTIVIIPARLESKRLTEKPLIKIQGKSLIHRVYNRIKKCERELDIVVATDSIKIAEHVKSFGGEFILTSNKHISGTDRCNEALQSLKKKYDLVINVQGDEPIINPKIIDDIINKFQLENDEIVSVAKPITDLDVIDDINIVKVEFNSNMLAKEFYRKPKNTDIVSAFKHYGIYAFKPIILNEICSLPPTANELNYKLEQLRALENKIKINVALAKSHSIGIDTKEDFVAIKKIMEYKT